VVGYERGEMVKSGQGMLKGVGLIGTIDGGILSVAISRIGGYEKLSSATTWSARLNVFP